MADDDSVKALLERLCSLQEQHLAKQSEALAKLSEALEKSAGARERLEKVTDTWQRTIATYEEGQKAQARRAVGYQIGAWLRTALTVFMLVVIVIAIIVQHYLK